MIQVNVDLTLISEYHAITCSGWIVDWTGLDCRREFTVELERW